MPCVSDWPRENYEEDRLRNELDKVTRLLCGLCKKTAPIVRLTVPELDDWWTSHQEADKERERRKAVEKQREIDKAKGDLAAAQARLEKLQRKR